MTYKRINRNSLRQFMRTRLRFVHVSKWFTPLPPDESGTLRGVWQHKTYRKSA